MKLVVLDFETQGDDPTFHKPTEVGAVLWDTEEEAFTERLSQLIYEPSYEPQTEEIVEITGITDEMLKEKGLSRETVFMNLLSPLVEEADYVLAHNKAFDQTVYETTCRAIGRDIRKPKGGWICTIQDVPYPKKYKCKKLSHLAYDHGVIVDPATLHRAIHDVELLAELILTRYDFNDILAYYQLPWAILFLNGVKGPWEDNGVTNAQAKKLGYSWERPWGTDLTFQKRWVKRIKEDQILAEKAKLPPHFSLTKYIEPEKDVL